MIDRITRIVDALKEAAGPAVLITPTPNFVRVDWDGTCVLFDATKLADALYGPDLTVPGGYRGPDHDGAQTPPSGGSAVKPGDYWKPFDESHLPTYARSGGEIPWWAHNIIKRLDAEPSGGGTWTPNPAFDALQAVNEGLRHDVRQAEAAADAAMRDAARYRFLRDRQDDIGPHVHDAYAGSGFMGGEDADRAVDAAMMEGAATVDMPGHTSAERAYLNAAYERCVCCGAAPADRHEPTCTIYDWTPIAEPEAPAARFEAALDAAAKALTKAGAAFTRTSIGGRTTGLRLNGVDTAFDLMPLILAALEAKP